MQPAHEGGHSPLTDVMLKNAFSMQFLKCSVLSEHQMMDGVENAFFGTFQN
jgi:hypothetical protein